MGYLLQPLLNIRKMRENRASSELVAARQAVQTAEKDVEKRKREFDEFERTKEERRDRIWDAIAGRAVSREQIDLANEGIARIDEESALRLDGVHRAESELKRRIDAADAARTVFVAATKNRMKIDEHKADWLALDAKEQNARAEGELEDFTGRKQNIDD